MKEFILALDQGTSSSRALLYDNSGKTISIAQQAIEMSHPKDGWVEQDPNEIWGSVLATGREVITSSGIDPKFIKGIGITNQRETTLVWNKKTGECVYNAIVWQDRRTISTCIEMDSATLGGTALSEQIADKTGLLIDPYFSSTKLHWILSEIVASDSSLDIDDLLFGTVDTYLIWKLTGGHSHTTDVTNASRTQLLNISSLEWDEDLLKYFDIPRFLLPKVLDSSAQYGYAEEKWFGAPVPITGVAGDQQAALVGQCCFDSGMSKVTLGTGCFIMTNTGSEKSLPKDGLLTTIAYRINGQTSYASEGSIFVAGQAVKWLRDQLGIIENVKDTEKAFIATKGDAGGVSVVPAFTGLGAPHWDPEARGLISGLTLDTSVEQIVVATLQSIALQIADLVSLMLKGGPVDKLRVDGGMAVNDPFCQFLADILGQNVSRPIDTETTARGAALLAGLGSGVWKDLNEIRATWQAERIFTPDMEQSLRDSLVEEFALSVERAKLRLKS